jgi:hypothetical protein
MSYTKLIIIAGICAGLLFLRLFPRRRRITSLHEALEALKKSTFQTRANANGHLRTAFGIQNPFVNGEKEFHDEYVKRVHRRLTKVTSDWSDIVDCAISAAKQVPPIKDIESIREAVRMIVMSIALKIIGVEGYRFQELNRVGELINLIWVHAKTREDTSKDREELYSILKQWRTDQFIDDLASLSAVNKECAILSLLIPSYETMYRVVPPVIHHSRQKVSFHRFLKHNVSTIDLNSNAAEDYTYLHLIQETLRLYPVVKRIKRSSIWGIIAIDIEQIHKETWLKADDFDPNRWMTGMRGGYLPFGRGRGRCIANELIVGMVVCVVLGAMETQLEKVGGLHFEELLLNGRVGNSL